MKNLIGIAAVLLVFPATAQIAHGGQPIGWGGPLSHGGSIPEITLGAMDRGTLIATEEPGVPGGIKYGIQRFFTVDVTAQGEWTTTNDDRRVCRLIIRSPGAVMISVQFDAFDLAPEAFLYLTNEDRTFFLGGFNEENEQATGDLASAVVPGDAVVIELQERDPSSVPSVLHISSITHGYRDIFDFGGQGLLRDYDPGFQSAACHNNVICPTASAWQAQKRAVAMFLRPDGNGCTGQLINNTQTPGIPYYYMATHCFVNTESQWVFYFNYESPACVGSTGPTTQTITGATLKAGDYYTDMCLMQLSSTPPAAYQPYYAGWDHSGNTPTTAAVIHHPLFDVKKITFDNSAATSSSVEPYPGSPILTYCWKNFWDSGIVEPVSSGSGLWDQNKRLVGHMFSGAQDCSNASTVFTESVKLSTQWDGASPGSRLRDWLDPANATMALNGYDPSASPGVLVKLRAMLEGPYSTGTGLMNGTLRSNGLVPLIEPYTALGYAHVAGGGGETTTSGVLTGSGSTSVVDWVVVELRDKNNSSLILATHSALLLRNGNIVAVNGTSDVGFNVVADNYYIAVRHRNHLGIMTQNAQALGTTATLKDFSTGGVGTYGGTAATKNISGKLCMYAGDVNGNDQLAYTGTLNDRDPILSRIGGTIPTITVNGYHLEDCTMDGVVMYAGAGNDRDIILDNIGGVLPTATRDAQLP